MVNSPVVRVIMYAYDLRDYQLAGAPEWARTERFDIAARAGREVTLAELRLMVQTLLADRFQLKSHVEQRDLPLYTLVVARADGRLGPNIRRSDDECKRMVERPANVPAGATTTTGCGSPDVIARSASLQMGAPVIDKTGLTGLFEYSMYSAQELPPSLVGVVPPLSGPANPDLPSYTIALQEQLGLKLEPSRAPVDVRVIDSLQQPTEN
jgi:uncharacterized protein (TIGR03435 family)